MVAEQGTESQTPTRLARRTALLERRIPALPAAAATVLSRLGPTSERALYLRVFVIARLRSVAGSRRAQSLRPGP